MRRNFLPFSVRAALFTFLLAVATLWQCDRVLHADDPRVSSLPPPTPRVTRDPAPVFVLFIDSLRYETAMDPRIMPALAALRAEGAASRMNTVYQGHTVPALRAIFTGGTTSGVFNVVTDFSRSNLHLGSLFSELRMAGRSSAAWSSGQFNQFGDAVETRFVHPFAGPPGEGDLYLVRDRRRVSEALGVWAEGRHALVAAHVEFTDYAGHQFGTGNENYRRYFAAADVLVAEAARRVPRDGTLVILGDHGHDERGEHKAGLDIPTVAVFRGPAFRPGFDLGSIEITEVGYFLYAALRAPLNRAHYPYGTLDRALQPGAEPPQVDRVAPSAASRRLPLLVLVGAALLAGVAWRLWQGAHWRAEAAAWAALGALALPGAVFGWAAVGLALGAIWFARAPAREVAGLAALAGALVIAGTQFVQAAGTAPFAAAVVRVVAGVLALVIWRRPAAERAWWLAAIAGLVAWVLEPWQHAAGWLGATLFGGLGLIWLSLVPVRRAPLASVGVGVVALGFAALYQRTTGGNWSFAVPISLAQIVPFAIAAGAAKLLIFRGLAPAHRGGAAVALGCALLLGAVAWQLDRSQLNWHPRVAAAGLVGLFGTAWLVARVAGARSWTPLLGAAALFAVFYHGVRAQPYFYAWADVLFAGFYLAARVADSPRARAALGVGGVALAYALAQGWLAGGVEWQALYDWASPEFVESRVGWFLPWILFRETLPFWIVRHLVVSGSGAPWPRVAVAGLCAAWILGLTLVVAGHFAASPSIEATQLPAEQLGGLGVLLMAALIGRRERGAVVAT